jgi:hypothetical protein
MSQRVRPLIGPGVPGPAGVSYLPRLWLRSCLQQVDLLSADLTTADEQFEGTLRALAGETDFARLADGIPTYIEFEQRFLQNASPLSADRIAAFNQAVRTLEFEEAEAAVIRSRVGLADPRERNARLLIDLDTWSYLHVLSTDGEGEIGPAISSTSTGPLGATHLPRMWAKALLTAAGRIPPGYNSGVGGGDIFTVTRLGLEMKSCIEMIAHERPTYLQYEGWVRMAGQHVDKTTIDKYNVDAGQRDKPPEMAAEIRALNGVTDSSLMRTVILNDFEDWYALHGTLSERSRALRSAR